MSVTVTRLTTTPVKGTRLHEVDALELRADGVVGNRRFFVVDERDRMLNSKVLGDLQQIVAECPADDGPLTLRFPDGTEVSDEVHAGGALTARFFSGSRSGVVVDGPFAAALSEFAGRSLRLVEAPGSHDRGPLGVVTLVSCASLARLASEAGEERIDPRRFRMTIEVDGLRAHEEDTWVGRTVRIGESVVRFHGHVGRCLITSRDPETGDIDLPTLDLLGAYRREVESTEPLPFGIHGAVVREGAVRVGDAVVVEDAG